MKQFYKSREVDKVLKKYKEVVELQEDKKDLELRNKDTKPLDRKLQKAKAEALKLRQEMESVGKHGYIVRDKNLMEKRHKGLMIKEYQEDLEKIKREIAQGTNKKELIDLKEIIENKIIEMKRGL